MTGAAAVADMSFLTLLNESLGGGCYAILLVLVVLFAMFARRDEVAGTQRAKRRRRELTAWMQSRGLTFRYGCDSRITERFASSCADQACNIYEGTCNGYYVLAFDYNCGDLRSRKRLGPQDGSSGLIVTTDLQMRPLLVQPRDLREGVTEFIGYDDIDFESAEFSSEFYVKSPDKRWAYDVLNQSAMELLLASPRFTLQFAGASVIAYNGYRFEASEFEAALTLIEGILQRLPPSLVHELQAGGQNA